ncbi:hypothetical protein [Caldisericum sp.]|uniref:hypothetical protein n=1 Tax=Caldisericum sp. TaxID=2499687 RepID=UPI003D0AC039
MIFKELKKTNPNATLMQAVVKYVKSKPEFDTDVMVSPQSPPNISSLPPAVSTMPQNFNTSNNINPSSATHVLPQVGSHPPSIPPVFPEAGFKSTDSDSEPKKEKDDFSKKILEQASKTVEKKLEGAINLEEVLVKQSIEDLLATKKAINEKLLEAEKKAKELEKKEEMVKMQLIEEEKQRLKEMSENLQKKLENLEVQEKKKNLGSDEAWTIALQATKEANDQIMNTLKTTNEKNLTELRRELQTLTEEFKRLQKELNDRDKQLAEKDKEFSRLLFEKEKELVQERTSKKAEILETERESFKRLLEELKKQKEEEEKKYKEKIDELLKKMQEVEKKKTLERTELKDIITTITPEALKRLEGMISNFNQERLLNSKFIIIEKLAQTGLLKDKEQKDIVIKILDFLSGGSSEDVLSNLLKKE